VRACGNDRDRVDADRSYVQDIAVYRAPRVDHSPSTLATGRSSWSSSGFRCRYSRLSMQRVSARASVSTTSRNDFHRVVSHDAHVTVRGGASMGVDEVDLTSRDAVRNS